MRDDARYASLAETVDLHLPSREVKSLGIPSEDVLSLCYARKHDIVFIEQLRSSHAEGTAMDRFINSAIREIQIHWTHATPNDFGAIALGIVLVSWFFCRFYQSN